MAVGTGEMEGKRPQTARTVSSKEIIVKLEKAGISSTDEKTEEIKERAFGVSDAKTTNLMIPLCIVNCIRAILNLHSIRSSTELCPNCS